VLGNLVIHDLTEQAWSELAVLAAIHCSLDARHHFCNLSSREALSFGSCLTDQVIRDALHLNLLGLASEEPEPALLVFVTGFDNVLVQVQLQDLESLVFPRQGEFKDLINTVSNRESRSPGLLVASARTTSLD